MKLGLHDAYAAAGAEDCLALYRAWAETYDTGFAEGMDYRLPAHVAAAFIATGATGPVLDVGAGTGLLAGALREMGLADVIDGVDFSPEMLERAAQKGIYRHLHQADVTRPLELPRIYGGIVSSGTFTAGHVGPEALPNLLGAARSGAQVALSVNRRVWASAGFDRALDDLAALGLITGPQLIDVEIYGAAAAALDADHADDRAVVVLFRSI